MKSYRTDAAIGAWERGRGGTYRWVPAALTGSRHPMVAGSAALAAALVAARVLSAAVGKLLADLWRRLSGEQALVTSARERG